MKTIFITSFHPQISRNILSTKTLEYLQQRTDIQIVILVPDYKGEYFRRQFASKNVLIEGVPLYQASKTVSGLFFKRLALFLFDTETARTKKKYQYYCDGKYIYYMAGLLVGLIGRLFAGRRILRYLDYFFSSQEFLSPLFDVYRPDLLFSTDVQNENDVSVMHAARSRRVPIIGMIRSWDNPSQRILRVFPEKLIVGSDTLKEEVEQFYRYPSAHIVVTGNPHYDRYLSGPSLSRDKFFLTLGLDPGKLLILYAPVGDQLIRHNDVDQYVMRILSGIDETQVLIRFPPDESVNLSAFVKPANIVYDHPGVSFRKDNFGDREMSIEDDQRLIDTLYYADVVVSGPTSIPLDAALLDKPAIMVNFYPTPRGFCGSIYNYWLTHIKKILATGGIFYARSAEELIAWVRRLAADPQIGKEGRTRIRSLWFSHADGKSSKRLAEEILSALHKFNENNYRSGNQ